MTHWLPLAGGVAIAAAASLFAARCYLELRAWARQCQRSRIAIAYKRRVQLDAPLVDWLEWSKSLGSDEASNGRVIYRAGHVSVAILKPAPPKLEVVKPSRLARLLRRSPAEPAQEVTT